MKRLTHSVLACLIWTLSTLPGSAFAWGTQGHHVIASLAFAQLTPTARAEVDRLLALEPGETLMTISTWADEHRNPASAPWHYVNFPRDSCSYNAERDCLGGQCVVAAIERQVAVLSSKAPDDKRLTALKYVVHLAGDVHQPLHAGYQDDKGGNTYQLQAFMRGSNLHALWDTGLIRNLNEETESITTRLLKKSSSPKATEMDATIAAEESCKIVALPGYYPSRKVGVDYLERFTPVMEQRLAIACARLAGLLNRAFR
jgi:nuclease S1